MVITVWDMPPELELGRIVPRLANVEPVFFLWIWHQRVRGGLGIEVTAQVMALEDWV